MPASHAAGVHTSGSFWDELELSVGLGCSEVRECERSVPKLLLVS